MMLAAFDPALATLTGVKRDSMCSVVSVNSAMAFDFFGTPETMLDTLDFDDESTNPASTESSPAKEKLMELELEDDLPSRKRRASRFQEPTFTAEEMLANLGDSSSSLFQEADYLPTSFEMEILQQFDQFKPEVTPQESSTGESMELDVVRSRSQSAERRRIQSELLARLECLDGIELPEEPLPSENITTIPLENDKQTVPENVEPKLGIYTEKQRIDRLNAYREKRKQRVYGRVRYVLRQKVSENRPRVKGRFVKQTGEQTATPDSVRDLESSATNSPASSNGSSVDSPVRRVEFRVDVEESPVPKRGRTAWELFKSLSLLSPIRGSSKNVKDKRPSLPATFSERLLLARRKSTTAASTASGKARRRFSRDEFFDEDEVRAPQEPDRKRATSMRKWDQ